MYQELACVLLVKFDRSGNLAAQVLPRGAGDSEAPRRRRIINNPRKKIMSTSQNQSADFPAFVAQVKQDFAKAFRVLKETRTLSATYTLQAYVRVPG
jgi:hypothetical protein